MFTGNSSYNGVFKFIGLSTVLILILPQSLLRILLKDVGFFLVVDVIRKLKKIFKSFKLTLTNLVGFIFIRFMYRNIKTYFTIF